MKCIRVSIRAMDDGSFMVTRAAVIRGEGEVETDDWNTITNASRQAPESQLMRWDEGRWDEDRYN